MISSTHIPGENRPEPGNHDGAHNIPRSDPAASRRIGSRFLAASLLAMGGVGAAATVASASPASGEAPLPPAFEVELPTPVHEVPAPRTPTVTIPAPGPVDLTLGDVVIEPITPEFEPPAEDETAITLPGYDGPLEVPDPYIPDDVVDEAAEDDEILVDEAVDEGTDEGEYPDGEGDDGTDTGDVVVDEGTEEGEYPDGEGQVGDAADSESAARSTSGDEVGLAYTGNDSLLPWVGAGLLGAGALVTGWSILSYRRSEDDEAAEIAAQR